MSVFIDRILPKSFSFSAVERYGNGMVYRGEAVIG